MLYNRCQRGIMNGTILCRMEEYNMTLHEYIEDMRGKRIAIIGIGVSNTPLLELLLAEGIRVTACDKRSREQMGEQAEHLEQLGCELHLGADYLKDLDADVIFRTPGLRPDVPEISACVQKGAVLTSEMEVFFLICPCPIIAVTGSDGKTTTTTIIAELLKKAGKRVWVGGNIGHPLLCDAEKMQPEDFAVVELSSFQLLDMKRSPHIAVMTNLAPNHLDVHKDMDEYIAAKENIYLHQHEGDIAIFNEDNDITRSLSERYPRGCGSSAAARRSRTARSCAEILSSCAMTDARKRSCRSLTSVCRGCITSKTTSPP